VLDTEAIAYLRELFRVLFGAAATTPPVFKTKHGATAARKGSELAPAKTVGVAPPPVRIVASTGHRGWFAALLTWGGAMQNRCLEWMMERRHILPYLAATMSHSDQDTQLDYTRSTLWTNATAITPPPSLPGCGPTFFAGPTVQPELAKYWSAQLAAGWTSNATPFQYEPGGPFVWNGASQVEWKFPKGWGVDAKGDVIRTMDVSVDVEHYTVDEGWGEHASYNEVSAAMAPCTPQYVCPAVSVVAWCVGFSAHDRGKGRGLENALSALAPYLAGRLNVPAYYRSSPARLNEWWIRLVRWYHRAAWCVWAAETMRGSVHGAGAAPSWWASHCAAWGVGLMSPADVAHKGLPTTAEGKSAVLRPTDNAEHVESIMRSILAQTPVPGSRGSLGDQIAPGSIDSAGRARFSRKLLDIPAAAGSVDPPYSVNEWAGYAVDRWYAHESKKAARWSGLFAQIISIEASLCGAGFASAVTAPLTQAAAVGMGAVAGQIVSKVVSLAIQGAFRVGQSGQISDLGSWGDVVGLIGEAVNIAGIGQGGVSAMLPAGAWQALQDVGSAFPSFAGADNDALAAPLTAIRNAFAELRGQGWPYIEEAYGGLGLAADAKSAAGNVANLLK
jgi:hypothetical protein